MYHTECDFKPHTCWCPWVLKIENKLDREDRNTWRHNCVLYCLAMNIRRKLDRINSSPMPAKKPPAIQFVPEGKLLPLKKTAQESFGSLSDGRRWECDFDLPEFRTNGSSYIFHMM